MDHLLADLLGQVIDVARYCIQYGFICKHSDSVVFDLPQRFAGFVLVDQGEFKG